MSQNFDLSNWHDKEIQLSEAVEKIDDGNRIYIGNGAATPHDLLQAIVCAPSGLVDIQILQMIPGGKLPYLDQHVDRFRTNTFYALDLVAAKVEQGLADYTPISSYGLTRLAKEGKLRVDVALIKVTPPDKKGMCNLGPGVDFTPAMMQSAKLVIAEVNEQMPRTYGDADISVDSIDAWVKNDQALKTGNELYPGFYQSPQHPEMLQQIAAHVIDEIPDGATLKLDLSRLTNALTPYFKSKKHLGLHTDLLTDDLYDLIESGVIDNSEKSIDRGKTVVTHAHGSSRLYEAIDRHPDIQIRSAAYVNHMYNMARIDHLVTLVGGLKVDLSGQVATDTVRAHLYGGVYSVNDSVRAAGFSAGGKPIVVLPALSYRGHSNIVFSFPPGTGVSIPRADVHYVCTEFGIAYLHGKSVRERCLALIDIAHPDFRADLHEQAKESFYIHSAQPGRSYLSDYPQQWEQKFLARSGKEVMVRPIKPLDEDDLRDFFHHLSDQNVYMRYFSQIRSLPQKVLKHFSDIDYSKDMALVALHPPDTAEHEMVGIGQWIMDTHDNTPEMAFQIRDDWQGEGLGKYLFVRLIELARAYGYHKVKADVFMKNEGMNRVFESAEVPYKRRANIGVYTYIFDLTE